MHNITNLFLDRKVEQASIGFLVFSRIFAASLLWYQKHTQVHRVSLGQQNLPTFIFIICVNLPTL